MGIRLVGQEDRTVLVVQVALDQAVGVGVGGVMVMGWVGVVAIARGYSSSVSSSVRHQFVISEAKSPGLWRLPLCY
jgi:hypothetical protein